MSVVYLELDKIHVNNYNPNVMNEEKFEALKDFCQTNGAEQLDPIWVRRDGSQGFEVIDGEHRLKAAKQVGWKRLRAFIIDMEVSDAKSFNVRKNRERGKLDAEKMGKILFEEYGKDDMTQNGVGKKFGMSRQLVQAYIAIYKNRELIREKLNIAPMVALPFRKSRDFLEEFNREERGETPEEPTLEEPETVEPEEPQQLEKFFTRYAKALKNNPLPKVQKDEVETAIDFFKRLLQKEKIYCPICGEAHLQWRCGHEF